MSDTRTRWRLIVDGPRDGASNMAIDRAIQLEVDARRVPPTLRLYQWARPTVTLGRFQDSRAVDPDACERFGVDAVKRFTGGRGVLHDDEVTYSVVASVTDGVPRGTSASYALLSSALAETYRTLGIDADLEPRRGGASGSSACYLHRTAADLSLSGKKLSGSAQVWLHDTVLQHGSFVITRDASREAAVFGLDRDATVRLVETTVTLAEELSPAPDRAHVVKAAIAAFASTLRVTLEPGNLTLGEQAMADALEAELAVSQGV